MAQNFGILISQDPDSPPKRAFFLGTSLSLPVSVSSIAGQSDTFTPQNLFVNGNTFCAILYDNAAHVFRAYVSVNAGVTWAEQDAAHAPLYGTGFAGGPNAPAFGCCQSTLNPNLIFVTYYAGAGLTLTLIPFTMGAGWGAPIASTLTLASKCPGAPLAGLFEAAMAAIYRPNDDSVIVVATIPVGNNVIQSQSTYFAQCKPNSSGWVNTLTLVSADVSSTFASGITGIIGSTAAIDPAGNIGVWSNGNNAVAATNNIYFQRIHPDNSVGALQTVQTGLNTAGGLFDTAMSTAAGVFYAVYEQNTGSVVNFLIGASSDAPTWTIQAVPLFTVAGTIPNFVALAQIGGVVTAFALLGDNFTVQSSPAPFTAATTLAVVAVPMLLLSVVPFGSSTLTLTFKGMKIYGGA